MMFPAIKTSILRSSQVLVWASVRSLESRTLYARTSSNSSFPPLVFPFVPGHRILKEAQSILEKACFDFAKKAMPDILQWKQWACAEAAELNLWAKVLKMHEGVLVGTEHKPVLLSKDVFYKSIANIRHMAVHRIPVAARELDKLLVDGEALACLLGDKAALSKLSNIRSEVKRIISIMEDHRNVHSYPGKSTYALCNGHISQC